MIINILTLFPSFFESPLSQSIIFKAIEKGKVKFKIYNLRDFGIGKRKNVDAKPYGGGPGMVLRVDVLDKAIQKIKKEDKKTKIILLTPKGKIFNQQIAQKLSKEKSITLICGHYEGFDERIRDFVDEEISVGNFILSGGESAAIVIIDAIVRLLPQVLGNPSSLQEESFSRIGRNGGMALEYPQYTRPRKYKGKEVPSVLLSGDHKKIEEWRKKSIIERKD